MKISKKWPEILLGLLLLILGGVGGLQLMRLFNNDGGGAVCVFVGFFLFLVLFLLWVMNSPDTHPRKSGSRAGLDLSDLEVDGGDSGGGGDGGD